MTAGVGKSDTQSFVRNIDIIHGRNFNGYILLVRTHMTRANTNTQGKATAALAYTQNIAEADAQVKYQISQFSVPGVSVDHEAMKLTTIFDLAASGAEVPSCLYFFRKHARQCGYDNTVGGCTERTNFSTSLHQTLSHTYAIVPCDSHKPLFRAIYWCARSKERVNTERADWARFALALIIIFYPSFSFLLIFSYTSRS